MLGMFFTDRAVKDFDDAKTSNLERFAAYYRQMLEKGVYLAPSQFEALFVSTAHTEEQIETTLKAAEDALAHLSR